MMMSWSAYENKAMKRKRILTAKELADKYKCKELSEEQFLRNVANELSKQGFGIYIPGKI